MRIPILKHHVRLSTWINEFSWRRFECRLHPPINPYDPPSNYWTFLLVGFRVTVVVRYAPRRWPCDHPTDYHYAVDGRTVCFRCSSYIG